MAIPRDVLQILVELLTTTFGQFPAPPLNPNERAAEESEEKEHFEVEIPISSGKMTFAAEERLIERGQRTEVVLRLALSEEAIAAGLLEKAYMWAKAAERVIREKFPKLEERFKIAITEFHHTGDVLLHHILTIETRKR